MNDGNKKGSKEAKYSSGAFTWASSGKSIRAEWTLAISEKISRSFR
jgi:hypothetical protein